MYILGISDSHNSSVCLLQDGKVICAMQEERFVKEKNFWGIPKCAIKGALDYAGITIEQVDLIAFSSERTAAHVNFSRDQVMQHLRQSTQRGFVDMLYGRSGLSSFQMVKELIRPLIPQFMVERKRRAGVSRLMEARRKLLWDYFPAAKNIEMVFHKHHDCHVATAAYGEGSIGIPRLIFTNDGEGDFICATVNKIDENGHITRLKEWGEADSIGRLWAIVTLMMGFVPFEHEYKLMGMAPYASPERSRKVADSFRKLFIWDKDGWKSALTSHTNADNLMPQVRAIQEIFRYERFDTICGGLQLFTEEYLERWVVHWIDLTGINNVALSGGTFMNIKANLCLMNRSEVKSIFIFPSCGDETNSIGAAYKSWYESAGKVPAALDNFYLGRDWSDDEIEASVNQVHRNDICIQKFDDIESVVAAKLSEGEIVARFKGREEFGARALGNRSILANPSQWRFVSEINDMIKQRDFWMPFACSVLIEDKDRYLIDLGKSSGEYMIMAFDGGAEINSIVAGTHPRDRTVRPHVVRQDQNPDYHNLISKFKGLTNIGAVLNTSFNLHGFPLVHTPDDAVDVFLRSGLRNLAIGNYLLSKNI